MTTAGGTTGQPRAPAAAPAEHRSAPADLAPVGVVFVHGVGSQEESATLREFAPPLLDWLAEWHRTRSGTVAAPFAVVESHLSYGDDLRGPARLRLRVPAYVRDPQHRWPERTWVLAEAWWATRLRAPDFLAMLDWSWRMLWRAAGRLAVEMLDRAWLTLARLTGRSVRGRKPAHSDPGAVGALIELLSTLLFAVTYIAGGLLGYVVLIPLFVIAQVPIEAWQRFVLARLARPFLVENVGDFRTYLEDDVQALHIRRQVFEVVDWLAREEGCAQICVVAHSHGAVVAFDAVTAPDLPHAERVRKLITLGGALNKAWELEPESPRVGRTLPPHVFWLDCWSYYDPVPAGQVRREIPGTPPLVAPTLDVQQRMHWYEEYVHPDQAPQGGHLPPTGPLPRELTNVMNVLTDHGAYWRNPEQFVSRLAQEIDDPDGHYQHSRFWLADHKERVRRRRVRVNALVAWRLAAMALFAASVLVRAATSGAERLAEDGRAIARGLALLHVSDVASAIGAFFDGVGAIAAALAEPSRSLPPLARLLDAVRPWLDPGRWEPLVMGTLGVLATGGLFALLYLVLTRAFFDPWDTREARASEQPQLAYPPAWIPLRTLAVVLPLVLLAYLIGQPGAR